VKSWVFLLGIYFPATIWKLPCSEIHIDNVSFQEDEVTFLSKCPRDRTVLHTMFKGKFQTCRKWGLRHFFKEFASRQLFLCRHTVTYILPKSVFHEPRFDFLMYHVIYSMIIGICICIYTCRKWSIGYLCEEAIHLRATVRSLSCSKIHIDNVSFFSKGRDYIFQKMYTWSCSVMYLAQWQQKYKHLVNYKPFLIKVCIPSTVWRSTFSQKHCIQARFQ